MDSELSPYFYALRSNEEGRSVCGIVSCAPEQDTGIPERFLAAAARFPEAWIGLSLPFDGLNQTSFSLSQAFFSCNHVLFQQEPLRLYLAEPWEEAPEPLSKSVEHVSHQITALPDGPLLSPEQM